MSKYVGYAFPIILEGGVRFGRWVYLGGFFDLRFATTPDPGPFSDCQTKDVKCGVTVTRWGFDIRSHLTPDRVVDVWLGSGMGFETMRFAISYPPEGSGGRSASGVEYLHFDLGADYCLPTLISFGPFVGFSLAQYDSVEDHYGATVVPNAYAGVAWHEWIMFGIRASGRIGL